MDNGDSYALIMSTYRYGLKVDVIQTDFKSGLESLLMKNPIRAIFLGVRIGDPTAVFFIPLILMCQQMSFIILFRLYKYPRVNSLQ